MLSWAKGALMKYDKNHIGRFTRIYEFESYNHVSPQAILNFACTFVWLLLFPGSYWSSIFWKFHTNGYWDLPHTICMNLYYQILALIDAVLLFHVTDSSCTGLSLSCDTCELLLVVLSQKDTWTGYPFPNEWAEGLKRIMHGFST